MYPLDETAECSWPTSHAIKCFLKCLVTLLGIGTLPLDVPTSFFYHTTLTMH